MTILGIAALCFTAALTVVTVRGVVRMVRPPRVTFTNTSRYARGGSIHPSQFGNRQFSYLVVRFNQNQPPLMQPHREYLPGDQAPTDEDMQPFEAALEDGGAES